MSAPLTHFVVIRRDLTFGEYSAQLAHAGEAYQLLHDPMVRALVDVAGEERRYNETIAVVKGARNEGKLLKLEASLVAAKVPHVAIREDINGRRLDGQLTVISFKPRDDSDGFLRKFLNDYQRISGLDPVEEHAPSIPG
jgi:hypothetical protein